MAKAKQLGTRHHKSDAMHHSQAQAHTAHTHIIISFIYNINHQIVSNGFVQALSTMIESNGRRSIRTHRTRLALFFAAINCVSLSIELSSEKRAYMNKVPPSF